MPAFDSTSIGRRRIPTLRLLAAALLVVASGASSRADAAEPALAQLAAAPVIGRETRVRASAWCWVAEAPRGRRTSAC